GGTTPGKAFTGPILVNAGRMRFAAVGSPTASSSVTVGSGGQITFTGVDATVTLGAGSLFLNGTGRSDQPGAIRADQTNTTSPNPIVLQSNSSINVPGPTASLNIQSSISQSPSNGNFALQIGTLPGDQNNQGTLNLNAASTYSGGTTITQGTVVLNSATA